MAALLLAMAVGPAWAAGIAVTFDDLPMQAIGRVPEGDLAPINKRLVGVLSERRIPAVGFVNEGKLERDGRLVPERVAILELWIRAGLELGNHGYGHLDLHGVSLAEYLVDIDRGGRVTRPLSAANGSPYRYFRHPFLHTGRDLATRDRVRRFLAGRDLRVAPVTIDNSEWIYAAAYERAQGEGDESMKRKLGESYVDYMLAKTDYYAGNGRDLFERDIPQVLLVHVNRLNADWFGALADRLSEAGHEFVTLESALTDPAYQSEWSWTGSGGISWLHRWALEKSVPKAFFAGEPETPGWVMEYSGVGAE